MTGRPFTYGSVCSGIEAATVAWHPLGWKPAFFSEIEAFPRAVLAHHYPEVPLHGDFTTIQDGQYEPIDLLVGGTPCQSFSVAGLRGGLDDERGNLALEYLRLAQRLRPRWLVWENVPGVLSSNGGRDFGAILGGMVELGYGVAYRVLDAQFFRVAQRRRRVFAVGYLGDWRPPAAVLFERHSLSGHPAPLRTAREGSSVSPTLRAGGNRTGGDRPPGTDVDTADSLIVAHSLRGEGFDASEDGTGRGTPLVPVEPYVLMERGRDGSPNLEYRQDGTANAILTPNGGRGGLGVGAIAFAQSTRDEVREMPYVGALSADPGMKQTSYVRIASAVRRLTPRECERLQGFPDDYTLIAWRGKPAADCPDGPRYKALGNSMAVPCMAWIGQRIAAVEAIQINQAAA